MAVFWFNYALILLSKAMIRERPDDDLGLPAPVDVSAIDTGVELLPLDETEVAADVMRTMTGAGPFADRDPKLSPLIFRTGPMMPHESPFANEAAIARIRKIEMLKLSGDYERALAEGENYWMTHFITDFSWPLYLFLSEICAKMCLMVDPLRDSKRAKGWYDRLTLVRSKLAEYKPQLQEPFQTELKFFFLALEIIYDFFRTCQVYTESISSPCSPSVIARDDEDAAKRRRKSYGPEIWDMFRSRLRNVREVHGKTLPTTVDHLSVGSRTFRMFDQLSAMITFMEALADAERDRWSYPELDRDAAIRTKPLAAGTQQSLAAAVKKLDLFIASFGDSKEQEKSALVISACLAKVRNFIDQGKYFEATREANALMSRFKEPQDHEFIAQLRATMGVGFFVFAELLLKCPDDQIFSDLLVEARKFANLPQNERLAISRLIDMGIANLRKALEMVHRYGRDELARRFRNQLLFGLTLKLEENFTVDKRETLRLIDRCSRDLEHFGEDERTKMAVPRLVQAICTVYDCGLDKFEDGGGQALLRLLAKYAESSITFLEEESLVPLQVADFETVKHSTIMVEGVVAGKARFLPELGPPEICEIDLTSGLELPYSPIPWYRLTVDEIKTRSRRSNVPIAYFEILAEKQRYLNRFLPKGKQRPVSVVRPRVRRVSRYRPTMPMVSAAHASGGRRDSGVAVRRSLTKPFGGGRNEGGNEK